MRVWTPWLILVYAKPVSLFPEGCHFPLHPEILGMWSSWHRLGQGQYMGLSLKMQKTVSSHFSSGKAQMNLILHPAVAMPEMPFPEEVDELGKLHPAAPWGAEGRASSGRARSIKTESCNILCQWSFHGRPRAKLDRLASAFHCRLGSLSHRQTDNIFSAIGPWLDFPPHFLGAVL